MNSSLPGEILARMQLWEEQVLFYKELVSKQQMEQEKMLDVIALFKKAGFWENYYPSNSHEALGISRFKDYEDRRHHAMIYVMYEPGNESFRIIYQLGQGNTVNEKKGIEEIRDAEIEAVNLWLSK